MKPEQQRADVHNRINHLMDRYARVMPIYRLLNEMLFIKFTAITNTELENFEKRLEKIETVLNGSYSNEVKLAELRSLK